MVIPSVGYCVLRREERLRGTSKVNGVVTIKYCAEQPMEGKKEMLQLASLAVPLSCNGTLAEVTIN